MNLYRGVRGLILFVSGMAIMDKPETALGIVAAVVGTVELIWTIHNFFSGKDNV